jgi:hypothetical protein
MKILALAGIVPGAGLWMSFAPVRTILLAVDGVFVFWKDLSRTYR